MCNDGWCASLAAVLSSLPTNITRRCVRQCIGSIYRTGHVALRTGYETVARFVYVCRCGGPIERYSLEIGTVIFVPRQGLCFGSVVDDSKALALVRLETCAPFTVRGTWFPSLLFLRGYFSSGGQAPRSPQRRPGHTQEPFLHVVLRWSSTRRLPSGSQFFTLCGLFRVCYIRARPFRVLCVLFS